MQMTEVTDLMNDVFSCSLKESKEGLDMFLSIPKADVYDSETEGWSLCIKKEVVDSKALSCLEGIAKRRELKIRESTDIFTIYTPRKNP